MYAVCPNAVCSNVVCSNAVCSNVVCSNVVCSNVVAQMLQHNVVKSQNVIVSITQAATVITDAYTIVEDSWDSNFTSSNRHHLLTVKLKYAKVLNGSIIEEHFLPNSQWTCTGTMAKGNYWTVNNFNASFDDRRAAMVSLSPVPQNFASDNIEVSNSMSSDVTRFLCTFSKV